jgi:hypothetical protein
MLKALELQTDDELRRLGLLKDLQTLNIDDNN